MTHAWWRCRINSHPFQSHHQRSFFSLVKVFHADGTFDMQHERSLKGFIIWLGSFRYSEVKLGWQDTIADILPPTPLECPGDLICRYVGGLPWVMHRGDSFMTIITPFESQVCVVSFECWMLLMLSITDLRGMFFDIELKTPFKPYQKLMGVASMDHIPLAYQVAHYHQIWLPADGFPRDLMYDPNSAFYPLEFEQDWNGKRGCWRQWPVRSLPKYGLVMLNIYFQFYSSHPEEIKRNIWVSSMKFSFNPTLYPSSLPERLPPLYRCTRKMEPGSWWAASHT